MKKARLYIDMGYCLVLLPLMLYVFPIERWWGTNPPFFFAFIAWLYVTYFVYSYYVIPRISRPKKRLFGVLMICITIFVTYLFSTYRIVPPGPQDPMGMPMKMPPPQEILNAYPVWGITQTKQAVWLHFIYVVTFSFATGLVYELYKQRMMREEIEFERNKAELQLYKAQINPHFLFNALNTIYGLLITHSENALETFEQFISITKYTYNNAKREFISVSEEVTYVEQFLKLQAMRLNDHATVTFNKSIENEKFQLPPMLLITFVENAFKHGISSNEDSFININLEQKNDAFEFLIENSKFKRESNSSMPGVGLENCRKRLKLLYDGRYNLSIDDDDEKVFRVNLKISSSAK